MTTDTVGRPEFFLRQAGWHPIFDFNVARAVESRRSFFGRIAPIARIIISPSRNGYILDEASGFRFVPANWTSVV